MSAFRVTCPTCGERPASEFTFGGELIPYPAATPDADDDDYERVWQRDNALGPQVEEWFHTAGCRRWLTVTRDTLTNKGL